jgi:phosphatidylserine/phosphatidylglycerophosphate/cardiolipin synthase-like enzyme
LNTELIIDEEIYRKVILEMVPATKRFLWIGTADIKDMYVTKGQKMVPFLEILSNLLTKGVQIRLIYAKEPGPAFRKDFDKYPNLIHGLEQMHCPRVHFITIISDGKKAFTGSANLTGAGLGAKSSKNRNFEAGILTSDPVFVDKLMSQFDQLWIGKNCGPCGRKEYCSEWQQFETKEKKKPK